MSTPGSGGPQPPEQDPSQSGQPWGQQPPSGQPQPGQQPWGDASQQPGQPQFGAPQQPGQPQFGAPQQPGQPGQPWGAPPQGPGGAQAFGQAQPEKPKRNKLIAILGAVVAAVVVFTLLSRVFGAGDPEVGDCVQPVGLDEVEVVDCDSDDAEYKVLGTDGEMTGTDFAAASAEELCTDVDGTTDIFWLGADEEEDGKVYCAAPV